MEDSNDKLSLDFSALFNIEEIQKIQDSFANATGVASIITDTKGVPITQPSNFCRLCKDIIRKTDIGLRNCIKSDCILGRKNLDGAIMQPCHSGGLWDGGASITVGGKHIANWLIGQVRNEEQNEKEMLEYAHTIGVDENEFLSALNEVPIMPTEQFKKICDFLFIMANQLSLLAYKNILQKNTLKRNEELQEKLLQKSKMDAIGQLAGGIAHDFNNLLTGITASAQLLLSPKRSLDEQSRKYTELIMATTQRATELTSKLLTFSRKGDRIYTPINIHQIINDTVSILERTLNKNISIQCSLFADKSILMGNLSDLQNSLINLGINASHAMPEGGHLIFTTNNIIIDEKTSGFESLQMQPGECIKISVRDTGCGISNNDQKKIFEPFFTTKKKGKGTGLGLSTVYGVIKSHGGIISVYSELEVGTEFYIYLPVTQTRESHQESSPIQKITGKGTILLIDDDKIVRIATKALLEDLGYNVRVYSNPLRAIDYYKNEYRNIDLVITDMIMPDMSGAEVFYKLKELNSKCKVIIISGFSINQNLQELLENGLAGFLTKPFTSETLSEIISRNI